jgi:trehalose 6-phosphate phosphatase
METVARDAVLSAFFRNVRTAVKRLLILDYDGTLAPFTTQRDEAFPFPGILEALRDINEARHTRLSILSGRPVYELSALLDGLRIEMWGNYGLERLSPENGYSSMEVPAESQAIMDAAFEALPKFSRPLIERKLGSLAMHWRGLERHEQNMLWEAAHAAWSKLAHDHRLLLNGFNGGIELRFPFPSKCSAAEVMLAGTAGTACAYIGDDVADEEVFKTLAGRALTVRVLHEQRMTSAELTLESHSEVLDFLRTWHQVCGGMR